MNLDPHVTFLDLFCLYSTGLCCINLTTSFHCRGTWFKFSIWWEIEE